MHIQRFEQPTQIPIMLTQPESLVKPKRTRCQRYFLDLASREGELDGYLLGVASHAQTLQPGIYRRRCLPQNQNHAHSRGAMCASMRVAHGFVRVISVQTRSVDKPKLWACL